MPENVLETKITADTSGVKAGVQEASSAFSNATSQIQSSCSTMNTNAAEATSGFSKLGDGIVSVTAKIGLVTAGIYAISRAFGSFIAEASEAETVEKRLAFALEAVGYQWDSAKTSVDRFANSIQETTRFSDEDARRALMNLLLYTNEYAKAQQGAKLAMDMSIRTGMDLATTARYIGMAMSGNVEMLGRYIPQFRNVNLVLDDNASMSEKAAYAMRVLQDKFGGTAQADLETYSGKVAQFRNAWSDFKETIGTALLPILKDLLDLITKIINSFKEFKPEIASSAMLDATISKFRGYVEEYKAMLASPGMIASQREMIERQIRIYEEAISRLEAQRAKTAAEERGVLPGGARDVFADEARKRDIVKEVELAIEAATKAEEERGAVAVAQHELMEGGWAKEKDIIKQVEDEIANLQRVSEEQGTIAIAQQELKEAGWERDREARTAALEEEIRLNNQAVDAKMEEVRMKADLGLISANEEIRILRDLILQKYALEREALDQIGMIWEGYPDKWREIQERIRTTTATTTAQLQREQFKSASQIQSTWSGVFNQIGGAFTSSIQGMINGTMTWQQAVLNILNSVLSAFLNMFMTMLTNYIATLIAQSTAQKTIELGNATASITASAATGAAKTAAANAENPYLAIVLAAAMFAAIIAYIALASAQGGWDVDKDSLAFVHKKEMVLPAEYAEGLRGIIKGGGMISEGGEQRITINNRFQGWDSTDVRRMLVRYAPTVYGTLRKRGRPYGIR